MSGSLAEERDLWRTIATDDIHRETYRQMCELVEMPLSPVAILINPAPLDDAALAGLRSKTAVPVDGETE